MDWFKQKINNIKDRFRRFKEIITSEIFIMECLFFMGVLMILATNFYINILFGMYSLGSSLIGLSIFLYKMIGGEK